MQAKQTNLKSISGSRLNLKGSQTKHHGNAGFLMGLNNRVSKLDKRLHRVEAHVASMYKHQITMKHLVLSFVLALLCFTSVSLSLREFIPINITAPSSLTTPLPATEPQFNDRDLSWPLEKTKNISDIEYNRVGKGIYIRAKLGDPVVAADDGEVIYSGKAIQHFGNLILVKHDNNIITVYGNNYNNYAKEGQAVKRGDLIAAAGERNGRKSGLYFEVRHKGEAQDPFLYLQQ